MGKHFGELFKLKNIVTYKISPFEQRSFAGLISHGFPNTLRRILDQVVYVVPPFLIAYVVYDQVEKAHHRTMLKNPSDYEDDK